MSSPVTWGVGAVVALVLPVLMFGPWLPLVDLVAFVGLYSYPPNISQGPLHFYTFQFSYIGFHALSRLLTDLHLPVRFQIPLIYWMQAGVCFALVWASLRRFVRDPWWCACAIALGTLAFWDGVFLWGGPLAHSLGVMCLNAAVLVWLRDLERSERRSTLLVTLLVLLAMSCHPFLLPFALIFCGVRFLFDATQRRRTTALALGLLVYGYVVIRDTPASEAGAAGGLHLLFGVRPTEIWLRMKGWFLQDYVYARALFRDVPWSSVVIFGVYAVVRLIGVVTAPFLILDRTSPAWQRAVATLALIGGGLFLFSCDLPGIPIMDWPQRVLTTYSPFLYVTGCLGAGWWWRRTRGPAVPAPTGVWRWGVPGALLVFVVVVQGQIFRLGGELEANVVKTRSELVASGVENAYVVTSGMDRVSPFYLRAVPFVLFSDPAIVGRNLILGTEWHNKARHPTRITEAYFNLGRKRYVADFSTEDRVMSVAVKEHPHDRFPVTENTNVISWTSPTILAMDQFNLGKMMMQQGIYAAAVEHFNTALHLRPGFAHAWNDAGAALVKAGQLDDGQTYFENAIKQNPNLVEAQANMGAVLVAKKRFDEALPFVQRALELQPGHPNAQRLLQQIEAAKVKP